MDTVKLVFVLFQVIARGTPDPLSLKHELPLQNLKNNHYLPYKLYYRQHEQWSQAHINCIYPSDLVGDGFSEHVKWKKQWGASDLFMTSTLG